MPVYTDLLECVNVNKNSGVHMLQPCDVPANGDADVKPMIAMTYCLTSGTKNVAALLPKEQLRLLRKGQIFNGYFIRTHSGPYNYCYKLWTRRQLPFPPLNLLNPKPDDVFECLMIDKNGPYCSIALESHLAFCTEDSLKASGYDVENMILPYFGIKARFLFVKTRPAQMPYTAFEATPVPVHTACTSKGVLVANFGRETLDESPRKDLKPNSIEESPSDDSKPQRVKPVKVELPSSEPVADDVSIEICDLKEPLSRIEDSDESTDVFVDISEDADPISKSSTPVKCEVSLQDVLQSPVQVSEDDVTVTLETTDDTIITHSAVNFLDCTSDLSLDTTVSPKATVEDSSSKDASQGTASEISSPSKELVFLRVNDEEECQDESAKSSNKSISNIIVGSISGFLKTMVADDKEPPLTE